MEQCTEPQMRDTFIIIVNAAVVLCRQKFGVFVLKTFIEQAPQWRGQVLRQLLDGMPSFAANKNASHIVQKCLEVCTPDEQESIVGRLLNGNPPHTLKDLALDHFGSYVLAQICNPRNGMPRHAEVRSRLASHLAELAQSDFGVRVFQEIQNAKEDEEQMAAAIGGA